MFHKKIILFAVGILGLFLSSTTQAAISPEWFCRSRAIKIPEIEKDTLLAVPLAEDVYEAVDPEFSNLQVFDDEGNPVASEVVRKSSSEEFQFPAKTIEMKSEKENESNDTLITIDIGKRPVSRIEFETSDRNFRRDVELLTPRPNGTQKVLKAGQISRIDLEGVEQEELALTFPEQRVSKLQLRIVHNENRPIEIEKIRFWGPTYECRFIAQPKRSYTLEYGSESPISVQLDTAGIDAARDRHIEPIDASLDDKVISRKPIAAEPEMTLNTVFSNPWLVYPIVGFLMVLLTLGLFVAAKRVKFEG